MPGFFDPVAATFVHSVLTGSYGYTLFDGTTYRGTSLGSRSTDGTSTVSAEVGLSTRPKAIVALVDLSATGTPAAANRFPSAGVDGVTAFTLFYPSGLNVTLRQAATVVIPVDQLTGNISFALAGDAADLNCLLEIFRMGAIY